MYHIIVNEDNLKSRKNARKLKIAERIFSEAGLDYTVHKTNHKGHPNEITKQVTSGSGNTVIAMGGDGTLHEILNGFVNFGDNRLGLIPLGTGNDFAKAVKIPLNVKKASEIIVRGATRKIDFIELSSGLRSLNAVGTGIDVDVLKIAYKTKSRRKSKYLRALIISLIKFESYNYTVEYDGKREQHFGLIGAIGNGKQIGGGIKVFPEAEADDGYLDLLVVDYLSKFATVGAFIKLMRGKINKIKQVTAIKTKSVKFIPHAENFTIQADGELYENVPLEAKVSDSKLQFFTPAY